MNNKILKIIKISSAFALAILFLVTSIYTYWNANGMKYFYEMSFLGNFITGIFLIVVGIIQICNKQVPQYLILCFTILMLLILGVEIVVQDFWFSDGWGFVHFVNPLLMFIFYLFISNQTNVKLYFALTTLAMPLAYMIFAFIFGMCTGDYVYDFLDYKEFGTGNTVLFIFGVAVGLTSISIGLY
ncbi:MAG: Pr6Pr family membrane protein, partial [Clostridiales bacterium]|nr:Pr6Pr family membrane protein [Clostridiales bacterium]